MKIDKSTVNPNTISSARNREVDNGAKSKEGGLSTVSKEIPTSAQVNVSSEAQRLQKAKEIASDSTVNEARVAELQKLIDEGNYKIDASAIADKMVDEHLLMSE